jgi:lon-related putative ATP-dependent protease
VVDRPDNTRRLTVPAGKLRTSCETVPQLNQEATDTQLATLSYLGQQRAVEALRFGIQVDRPGYNVFVLGPIGSHRHTLARELAEARAREKHAPDDWCYANNFADPERPQALRLPAGRGTEFRDDMAAAVEDVRIAIPAAFEGDDYRNQLKAIEAETQAEIEQLWKEIRDKAAKEDITVLQTPTGYVLAPMSEGKVVDDKDFEKLPKDKRRAIKAAIQMLSEELQARIESLPKLRKKQHERIRALDQEVAAHTIAVLVRELKNKYATIPDVADYLEAAQKDIIENAQEFRESAEPALPFLRQDSAALLATYEINLVVNNAPDAPAPVIYEPNPSYPNLVGKIEHRAEMGALLTDFRMVRGGALLQANGGYLVLDAHRVLGRPFAWDALKQALYTKQLRIESPADTLGFASTTTLKPEPIPLDVKVVLVGERWLYYLLSMYDREFGSLFKVAADFDDDMKRTPDNVGAYAELVVQRASELELLPFATSAIQRVIEQRARQADDSERLSMNIQSLDDLLVEADHWARERAAQDVAAADVVEAIERKKKRLSRVQSRIIDAIQRQTLLIDTSGDCVGQVNGLSVVDLGDYRFGHPVRITATTRVGTGDVVDIEREVELGGAIHSKGVMILSSVLSTRYARDVPLSLHGSVVFEQSYGGVDGDSASVAEFCALLSSIADLPIHQSIACTGSINQLGRVQAVGGINEKIEGFFDICSQRGLDGSHGVVIPADNVKHLMLREDVVAAVEERRFNVYAVHGIDEAIEILTGQAAGERGADGLFAEGTANRRVEDRLIEFAKRRKQFAETAGNGD